MTAQLKQNNINNNTNNEKDKNSNNATSQVRTKWIEKDSQKTEEEKTHRRNRYRKGFRRTKWQKAIIVITKVTVSDAPAAEVPFFLTRTPWLQMNGLSFSWFSCQQTLIFPVRVSFVFLCRSIVRCRTSHLVDSPSNQHFRFLQRKLNISIPYWRNECPFSSQDYILARLTFPKSLIIKLQNLLTNYFHPVVVVRGVWRTFVLCSNSITLSFEWKIFIHWVDYPRVS